MHMHDIDESLVSTFLSWYQIVKLLYANYVDAYIHNIFIESLKW